jgi:hypothetical protein
MKLSWWVLAFTAAFSIGVDGEAGTIVRDFSGDPMQSHDSRMMNSPLQHIPTVLGLSFWPFTSYLPAPSLTIVNVQINLSALVPPFPSTATCCAGPFEILDIPMRELCGDRSESGDEPNGSRTKPLLPLTAAGQYLREPHLFSEWRDSIARAAGRTREIDHLPDGDSHLSAPPPVAHGALARRLSVPHD